MVMNFSLSLRLGVVPGPGLVQRVVRQSELQIPLKDMGEIVKRGTHEELLRTGEEYFDLW
jgi:hypothetical protein